ncbi:hypothetical protein [Enterobacter ludwigii]|uniref:hypothetical protein n=1 Tax=Enterobacter ludwigii TaxID=299767 RepID=UPI0022E92089|nr:hypothetical protein [Enterobacter ludwigii]
MSTITRERVQWLHDAATEFLDTKLKMTMKPEEIIQLTTALLASLEAEKEYKHHSVIAEQLAHVLSSMDATDHQRAVISCAVDRLNNVSQLLQSSPSALLVPETLDYQGAKELFNYLMNEEETNATVNGWNACRAAMLQGSDDNSPVVADELIRRIVFNLVYLAADEKLRSDEDSLFALVRQGIDVVRRELAAPQQEA